MRQDITIENERILIVIKSKYTQLMPEDISYIEPLADYIIVYVKNTKFIVLSTMKEAAKKLEKDFIRVHRSYIVNKDKIKSIKGGKITIDFNGKNLILPIGRNFKEELMNIFPIKIGKG